MKGYIYSHKLLIGTTTFKQSFGSMGHIWGEFEPSKDYELIKKQVQEFCDQVKKDYKKWYSFRFNIQLENGYFLLPVGGVEILDFTEFPDEPISIHLAGVHSHVYHDYFENNKAFVLPPWQQVSIDEKIELEDELTRKIGETNITFSTLAKNSKSNQVLFAVHGGNVPPFVIANLQPTQNPTIEEVFPEENYFIYFEDVQKRMAGISIE